MAHCGFQLILHPAMCIGVHIKSSALVYAKARMNIAAAFQVPGEHVHSLAPSRPLPNQSLQPMPLRGAAEFIR